MRPGRAGPLGPYQLRAAILACHAEARRADERALTLTANPAERALLEQRLA